MTGSSPLARGLHWQVGPDGEATGIIPARAGFTDPGALCSDGLSDHPRSRGVYSPLAAQFAKFLGSSPLARGLLLAVSEAPSVPRIIPARAGFTLADPWHPNDEPHYQTAFAFTADLALAPQSSDNVVVSQRSTRTPSEA